jgi:hypothetical protein
MKRTYFTLFALLLILACKTDKKSQNNSNGEFENSKDTELQSTKTFESSILDLRTVNGKFNDQYGVEKFGMVKNNDSIYSFVFKLDNNTTSQTVEAYSIGIRIFDAKLSAPLNISFHPKIKNIEGNNYLVLSNKLKGIKYFDSLDVYIYKRKDWNSSGRLGEIKIKDILIE